MGFYQFKREQHFEQPVEKMWEFISNPSNLKKITPDSMGFDITSGDLPESMYAGMIISYKVSPLLGIKTTWVTEITQIKPLEFFIDEQRVGPYKLWHHQHHLTPTKTGTLMSDIVSYEPPFGLIGNLANSLIIKKKLEEIFSYREKVLNEFFG
jgi:ligand-binding SRPBCC domain-containing protein